MEKATITIQHGDTHPDGHTRSRNRMKDIQIHPKLSQTQILQSQGQLNPI